MKQLIAAILTIGFMALLLWSGSRPNSSPAVEARASDSPPESSSVEIVDDSRERIQTLLDAAWKGDITSYLDSFTGDLRDRIQREINERGLEKFAEDLKKAARARKSHAVFSSEPESPTSARVIVETVYPDRNERQAYRLEKTEKGWFVAEVQTVKGHEPKAKFGQTAAFLAPEGVPVQGGVTVETGDDPIRPEPSP